MAVKRSLSLFLCGMSFGALVGTMVGLSISGVVGIVLGGLVSLMVAFFGLKGDTGSDLSASRTVVAGFSVGCLLFILAGMDLRTHDVLTPSVEDYVRDLQKLKLDSATIQRVVLLKRYGVQVGGDASPDTVDAYQVASQTKEPGEKGKRGKTIVPTEHSVDASLPVLFAAKDHPKEAHEVAQHFSTYSLDQLKTFFFNKGILYEQFYNNIGRVKDTSLQKELLVQLIVVCYDNAKK